MHRPFAPTALAGAVVAAALALSGCSSSGPAAQLPAHHHGASAIPSAALPHSADAAAQVGKVSQISVRYANFFVHKGVAGPALDIYEGNTGEPGKLLVHDLAYGAVSSYVHPYLLPNQVGSSEGLITLPIYAMPTGEDPVKQQDDMKGLGSLADDGSHPQLTEVLQGEKDTIEEGPLGGLSFSSRVEKGSYNGTTSPDIPPPGTTELLADDTSVTTTPNVVSSTYLMIDTSCTSPANGDKNEPNLPQIFAADGATPKSSFAVFPEQPGTHQLAVATTSIDENLTCAKLTERQGQTTSSLTSGQQIEVYVYGPTPTDLHLVLAPVPA